MSEKINNKPELEDELHPDCADEWPPGCIPEWSAEDLDPLPPPSPRFIERCIHDYGIIGQNEAVKAAAMITYKRLNGLQSTSLFVGQTGCGKSEIWRAVSNFCDDYCPNDCKVSLIDGSQLTPEGWKGNMKLNDIIVGLLSDGRSAILVIDEFDKLLEPVTTSNGTNYTDIMQNEFLKVTDGDSLTVGVDDDGDIRIDTSRLSVVLLGAFQKLLECKSKKSGSLGFGAPLARTYDYSNSKITADDLIAYGMRNEIAARIQKIVNLQPLSPNVMADIGVKEAKRLGKALKKDINIDADTLSLLSNEAIDKGLGARWLKSRIGELLDEQIYRQPYDTVYCLKFKEPHESDERIVTAF